MGQRPRRLHGAAAASSTRGWPCWPRWSARRAWTPGEFDRLKSERLNDILQARADPGRLADESFLRELFAESDAVRAALGRTPGDGRGAHRRGRPRLPRQPLRAERGRRHHRRRHRRPTPRSRPSSGTSATGAGRHRSTGPSSRRQRGGRRIVLVDRPGSVQSELRVGHLGIDRYDPRYFPAIVMAAHARRRLRQPPQPAAARGAGLHLQRAQRLRSASRGRPLHRHRGGPDRGHGRRHPRAARTAGAHSRGAARRGRACGGARLPGRRLPAALRDDRRDRVGHRADRHLRPARTTGGRPTAPASRRSPPPTCTGSRGS